MVVSCIGETNGSIDLMVEGKQAYIYEWVDQDGNLVGSNEQSLENLSAGIYSVLVTDSNGCVDMVDVEITEPENGIELSVEIL